MKHGAVGTVAQLVYFYLLLVCRPTENYCIFDFPNLFKYGDFQCHINGSSFVMLF